MASQSAKELVEELNKHKVEVSKLRNALNGLDKEKESWFQKREECSKKIKEFIQKIKDSEEFAREWGDILTVYGRMWRKWPGADGREIDQIAWGIEKIKKKEKSKKGQRGKKGLRKGKKEQKRGKREEN